MSLTLPTTEKRYITLANDSHRPPERQRCLVFGVHFNKLVAFSPKIVVWINGTEPSHLCFWGGQQSCGNGLLFSLRIDTETPHHLGIVQSSLPAFHPRKGARTQMVVIIVWCGPLGIKFERKRDERESLFCSLAYIFRKGGMSSGCLLGNLFESGFKWVLMPHENILVIFIKMACNTTLHQRHLILTSSGQFTGRIFFSQAMVLQII